MAFRHIVLFKFHESVDMDVIGEARRRLRHLCAVDEGILEFRVELSLDVRKGTVMVQNNLFRNEDAYKKFHGSPGHPHFTNFIREIADWLIGDYEE